MNIASFSISVKECVKLFEEFNLLYKENVSNTKQPSSVKYQDFIEKCRDLKYQDYYRFALENDCYDLLLVDNSFLQFTFDTNSKSEVIRLAYYPSICKTSYNEYLKINDMTYEECGDKFMEDYQQYLIEQIPQQVNPIRYDYDKSLYKEYIHSSSHIHFGNEEDLRIPINGIIKPILFSKLVIEYFFYQDWKKSILAGNTDGILYKSSEYEIIDSLLFTERDKKIPYLFLNS